MVEDAPHGLLLHASAIFFSSSVPVTFVLADARRLARSSEVAKIGGVGLRGGGLTCRSWRAAWPRRTCGPRRLQRRAKSSTVFLTLLSDLGLDFATGKQDRALSWAAPLSASCPLRGTDCKLVFLEAQTVHLRRRGLLPRPPRPSARARTEGKRRRQRRLSIPDTPGPPEGRPAVQRTRTRQRVVRLTARVRRRHRRARIARVTTSSGSLGECT